MNPSPQQKHSGKVAPDAARQLMEFRKLRDRDTLCAEGNELFAETAVDDFFRQIDATGDYPADTITLLIEIATLEDTELAAPGMKVLFPQLIEHLSDSFDPTLSAIYDRVFSQIITEVRKLPTMAAFDEALNRYGLPDQQSLLDRRSRLPQTPRKLESKSLAGVRKFLVLSRVTLGADVAVTSLVLQKLRQALPEAERILIGPRKAEELFGGDPSLIIRPFQYGADGGLLGRLNDWLLLLEVVARETKGLALEEFLIIDSDSRLLQLGMLPVVPSRTPDGSVTNETRYLFFDSRGAGGKSEETISQLTRQWLNRAFGDGDKLWPQVWLREPDLALGKRLTALVRGKQRRPVLAVSFGVGGNATKRVEDPFEEKSLLALLDEGYGVVLDRGFGEEEEARASKLAARASENGYGVLSVDAESARETIEANEAEEAEATIEKEAGKEVVRDPRLITWKGGIGAWAGIIRASDLFVGYDSAGQHIAAAQRTALVDIFTDRNSALFRKRWKPTGPGTVHQITVVEGQQEGKQELIPALLARIKDSLPQ